MLNNLVSFYLFLTVLLAAWLGTYVISKSKAAYLRAFSWLSLAMSLYLLGYLLELNSTRLEQMIFWNQVQYLAIPFFPALWLLVALLYTRRYQRASIWHLVLILIIPVASFFLRLTNRYHGWYYRSMRLEVIGEQPLLVIERGSFYYVHILYSLVCLVVVPLFFYREYRESDHSDRSDRRRLSVLILASLLPFAALLLMLVNIEETRLDYVALLVPVSLFLILYSIARRDFLEMKTLAREEVFEENSDGLILMNLNGRIVDYNRAAHDLLPGLDSSRLFQTIASVSRENPELQKALQYHAPQTLHLQKSDREEYYDIISTYMHDKNSRYVGVLKTLRQVTETRKLEEELHYLATTDELSGLPNRRQFFNQAEQLWLLAQRQELDLAVLMLDIDHFKQVNDQHGHAAGDEVIRELGRILNKRMRESDLCGRIGGEEFAVVLPNTSRSAACKLAEELRRMIARIIPGLKESTAPFSISIGVAGGYGAAQSFAGLLSQADQALYQAKSEGRNRVACYRGGAL